MITWLYIALATVLLGLNIAGTTLIHGSKSLDTGSKTQLIIVMWALPVIGLVLSLYLFNRQLKLFQKKSDDELISALNEFTQKVNSINETIKKERHNKPH